MLSHAGRKAYMFLLCQKERFPLFSYFFPNFLFFPNEGSQKIKIIIRTTITKPKNNTNSTSCLVLSTFKLFSWHRKCISALLYLVKRFIWLPILHKPGQLMTPIKPINENNEINKNNKTINQNCAP